MYMMKPDHIWLYQYLYTIIIRIVKFEHQFYIVIVYMDQSYGIYYIVVLYMDQSSENSRNNRVMGVWIQGKAFLSKL